MSGNDDAATNFFDVSGVEDSNSNGSQSTMKKSGNYDKSGKKMWMLIGAMLLFFIIANPVIFELVGGVLQALGFHNVVNPHLSHDLSQGLVIVQALIFGGLVWVFYCIVCGSDRSQHVQLQKQIEV